MGHLVTYSVARHPIFARLYARLSLSMEQEVGEYRRRNLAGVSGRVLEIGAGNGLNFAHYPPEVTHVLAVEPEPYLRQIARRHAANAPVPVEVVDGIAEHLPAADEVFDSAVASLVLCSVTDQRAVARELYRVLRPGGTLHFFEHVQSETPGLRRFQRALDATIWPLVAGGCHSGRDTASVIAESGFVLRKLERFNFPNSTAPIPTAPHILGVASRPG